MGKQITSYCTPYQKSPGQEKILALLQAGPKTRKQIGIEAEITNSTNLSRHLQSLTSKGKIKLNLETGEYELYAEG